MTDDGRIEIVVASTVYGYEDQLNIICGLFEQMGYQPISSHYKTMPTDPSKSNLENCLIAVENADVLFGIIRPFYGSGIIGPRSIAHEEMKKAIELKKPRWFVAHRDIRVARELFKQYRYLPDKSLNPAFTYRPTKLMDDIRVIDMYNDTILNNIPPEERIGHWTDEFFTVTDIEKVIHTQFCEKDRIVDIIKKMRTL
jgi:hypothetical protein